MENLDYHKILKVRKQVYNIWAKIMIIWAKVASIIDLPNKHWIDLGVLMGLILVLIFIRIFISIMSKRSMGKLLLHQVELSNAHQE